MKLKLSIFLISLSINFMNIHGNLLSVEIAISELWFKKYGCPKKGPYLKECKRCMCNVPGSKKVLSCWPQLTPQGKCESVVIDNWKEGESCVPGRYFFVKCKYCKCDEDGATALCDSYCGYYPNAGM